MPSSWRRDEINLGMIVTRDDLTPGAITQGDGPLLYKVVAICDEPTVVIVPLFERDGDDREHHVISSPLFAEFHQVKSASEPGSFSIDFGSERLSRELTDDEREQVIAEATRPVR